MLYIQIIVIIVLRIYRSSKIVKEIIEWLQFGKPHYGYKWLKGCDIICQVWISCKSTEVIKPPGFFGTQSCWIIIRGGGWLKWSWRHDKDSIQRDTPVIVCQNLMGKAGALLRRYEVRRHRSSSFWDINQRKLRYHF